MYDRPGVIVGAFVGVLVSQMGNPLYYFGVDPDRSGSGSGSSSNKSPSVDNIVAVMLWLLLAIVLGLLPATGKEFMMGTLVGSVIAIAFDSSKGAKRT